MSSKAHQRLVPGLGFLLALALLAGCSSRPAALAPAASPPSAAPGSVQELAADLPTGTGVGDLAPAFKATNVFGGQSVSHVPGKPTALFFMAAWCSSCVGGEDALAQVRAKYGDKVQLISIDVDPANDTPERLKKFAQEFGGDWPHVFDTDKMLEKLSVASLDTTIIIGPDGKIIYRNERPTPFLLLDRALSKLFHEVNKV